MTYNHYRELVLARTGFTTLCKNVRPNGFDCYAYVVRNDGHFVAGFNCDNDTDAIAAFEALRAANNN